MSHDLPVLFSGQAKGKGHTGVPAHATWFDYNAVHEREEAACPLFFRKGKDPEQASKVRSLPQRAYACICDTPSQPT